MASFLEDITPFMGQENGMGKDRHWKNFWKNMIHIDIKSVLYNRHSCFLL